MSEPTFSSRINPIVAEADAKIADLEAEITGHDTEVQLLEQQITTQQQMIGTQQNVITDLKARLKACNTRRLELRALLDKCREGNGGGDPDPDPEPLPRFNGDPGRGKIRIGWDVEGGRYENMVSETETMRKLLGDQAFLPMTWREYGYMGERTVAPGSSAFRAGQRGCHIMANWDFSPQGAEAILAGDRNPFINQLITDLRDCEAEGINVIVVPHNEADGDPAYMGTTKTHHHNRYLGREASVYFARKIKDAGLSNVAIGTQTFIAATWHNAAGRLAAARKGQYGTSTRNDHPAEYILGWDGKWDDWPTDGLHPNPDNFDLDLIDILCVNQYCWHGMDGYGNYNPLGGSWAWDEAEYRYHTLLDNTPNHKHMWYSDQYRRNLFGAAFPVGIGEYGWPVHENRQQSFVDVTVDHWSGELYDQLIQGEVVWAGIWKQVAPAGPISSSAQSMGGRYAQQSETNTKGQVDPRDARRWAVGRTIQRATQGLAA